MMLFNQRWINAIFIAYVITNLVIVKGDDDDAEEDIEIPIHCPANTFYASLPVEEFTIDATHIDHINHNTQYKWRFIQATPANVEQTITWIGKKTSVLTFQRINTEATLDFDLTITVIASGIRERRKCPIKVTFSKVPIFSIDLGTTFSCIAYRDVNKEIHIIQMKDPTLENKVYCIPTVIYFPPNQDEIKIGYEAKEAGSKDPKNVVSDAKRIMGRRRNEKEVQIYIENHAIELTDDIYPKFIIPNRNNMKITPEQALSAIIIHLVEAASKHIKVPYNLISNITISVPAFFHNGPRKAVRSACHLSNAYANKLVVEPTSAAVSFVTEQNRPELNGLPFLTFDFGGGTLDCSIVRCKGHDCQVLAVSGDPALGGIDFDNAMTEIIISKLIEQNVEITENIAAIVMGRAEEYKKGLVTLVKLQRKKLNTTDPAILNSINPKYCEYFKDPVPGTPKICVSMKEFEKYHKTQELIQRAVKTAQNAVDQYISLGEAWVDFILLVGGSSHLPFIETALDNHFKNVSLRIEHPNRDKQHLVVAGGAIIAAKLETAGSGIADVVPLSFGFSKCVGQRPNSRSTASTVDLVYVIDATGSMDPWIDAVRMDIKIIIDDMKQKFPQYTFRVAGVAYRDWGDENHIEYHDFTNNIETFMNWLNTLVAEGCGVPCYGGGAEDVLGGLNKASELSWSKHSALKLLIHICDRPPHNTKYHDKSQKVPDEWPTGHDSDPNDYHKVVLNKLNEKGVVLMVAKLTEYLETMIEQFRSFASEIGMKIYDKPITGALELFDTSENILVGELGDIKSANEQDNVYVKDEDYSGKYECGILDVIIPKNTPYNTAKSKQYCTHNPEDTQAKFQLFEADHKYVNNGYWLSNITVFNVSKGSCETSTINVTFYIDSDGIASVTAQLMDGYNSETVCDVESCSLSLDVLSKDGALTWEEIIEQRKPMINWFSSNTIRTVLQQN